MLLNNLKFNPFTNVDRFLVDSILLDNIEGVKLALDNGTDVNSNWRIKLYFICTEDTDDIHKLLISKGIRNAIKQSKI